MSRSLAFFPAPFPDETLHSVLSRHCRLAGSETFSGDFSTGRHAPHFAHAVPFPCGIEDLVARLGPDSPWTTDYFITSHTELPYYQPFLSRQRVEFARQKMRSGPPGSLTLQLGVVASRLARFQRVRFCSSCIGADIKTCGQAYWHRVHQLPGVWVCPVHGRVLSEIDPKWGRTHTALPYLPDCLSVAARTHTRDFSAKQTDALLSLAESSRALLEMNAQPIPSLRLRRIFQAGCARHDLFNHHLQLAPLTDMVFSGLSALPQTGEFAELAVRSQSSPPTWVTALLRKHRSTHHPLKYLLLMQVLGLSSTELQLEGDSADRSPHERRCDEPVLADGAVNVVEHASLPNGPSDSQLLKRKSANTRMVANAAAILAMAESGMSSALVARELRVSMVTVNRVLRAHPEVAARRNTCRSEADRCSRRNSFLRQHETVPARKCSDYPWLYRNDRKWLTESVDKLRRPSTKRHPCVDWAQRDADLSAAISPCVSLMRAREGKPSLISKAAIGRELAATDWFEKYAHQLPLCRRLLEIHSEGKLDYLERRMRWAAVQVVSAGKPLVPTRLQRVAGIRERTPEFESIWKTIFSEWSSQK